MASRQGRLKRWSAAMHDSLLRDNLWQRMVKYTIAVTCALIVSVVPAVSSAFGPSTFLGPFTTVFGHCGQRLGLMIESLAMIIAGSALGVGWSALGMYLSSLAYGEDEAGAYTIRAIFVVLGTIFHGYLRANTPRLFNFVLFFLNVTAIALLGSSHQVSKATASNVFYPILTAVGILLLVNVAIFPELSSSFVAKTTIETLGQAADALKDAQDWFVMPAMPMPADQFETTPEGQNSARPMRARSAAVPDSNSRAAMLASLTERKGRLRSKLVTCKAAQEECMYEVSFSVLPPRNLKPISNAAMTGLVQSIVSVIGTCESKFALTGDPNSGSLIRTPTEELREGIATSKGSSSDEDSSGEPASNLHVQSIVFGFGRTDNLSLVKPRREIESGDIELFESILDQIRGSVQGLRDETEAAVRVLTACLAYCYDVPRLPSGGIVPKGISLEAVDILVDVFSKAIQQFDDSFSSTLKQAAQLDGTGISTVNLMPGVETFLVSSFVLSLRQTAVHVLQMLRHARGLLERRQSKHNRRRLYLPTKINWRRYLLSGGEADGNALPQTARKEVRAGRGMMVEKDDEDSGNEANIADIHPKTRRADEEDVLSEYPRVDRSSSRRKPSHRRPKARRRRQVAYTGVIPRIRGVAADILEGAMRSEDLSYALKMAIAIVLVTFPAFQVNWNSWYVAVRGIWAPLQLILVFEVAIGTSFWVFLVRSVGVIFGCVLGYLSFVIGNGNFYVLIVVLVFGIVPSAYVQLGTPYVKAGMISVASMSVVALAAITGNESAWENFVKRLVAFLVGGAVALAIEVLIAPVKARDRLVESLSSCIHQMTKMQVAVAAGVDDPVKVDLNPSGPDVNIDRFRSAREKAKSALAAAETFLPFCLSEPRLKGSFRELEPVFREIVYVLHQIIDRMDNIVQLRAVYGSSILEELNPLVYLHRRNIAASIKIALFAVNEALTTRLPLPQFLPSSRLAQLRLVHRVREILATESGSMTTLSNGSVNGNISDRKNHGDARGLLRASQPARPFSTTPNRPPVEEITIQDLTRQKFVSWGAATAGQMEIIEYVEELVDLAKLLVGVNAFRSGMLERPSYRQYVKRLRQRKSEPSATHQQQEQQQNLAAPAPAADAVPQVVTGVEDASFTPPGPDIYMQRPDEGRTGLHRRSIAVMYGSSGGAQPAGPTLRGRFTEMRLPRPTAEAAAAGDGEPRIARSETLPASLQRVQGRVSEGRRWMRRMSVIQDENWKGKVTD